MASRWVEHIWRKLSLTTVSHKAAILQLLRTFYLKCKNFINSSKRISVAHKKGKDVGGLGMFFLLNYSQQLRNFLGFNSTLPTLFVCRLVLINFLEDMLFSGSFIENLFLNRSASFLIPTNLHSYSYRSLVAYCSASV